MPFRYRADLRRLEDLKPGLVCPGIVTNVTTFGAFVDVGVPQDGLVHVSQLPAREASDPRQALLPGDRVEVRVVKVDLEKKQISLSMRAAAPRPASRPRPAGATRPAIDGKRNGRRDSRPRPSPAAATGSSGEGARSPRPRPAPRPTRPPAAAAKPGPRPELGARKDRPASRPERPAPRPDRPSPQARPAFNNPFAVLAKLKEPKKE